MLKGIEGSEGRERRGLSGASCFTITVTSTFREVVLEADVEAVPTLF